MTGVRPPLSMLGAGLSAMLVAAAPEFVCVQMVFFANLCAHAWEPDE